MDQPTLTYTLEKTLEELNEQQHAAVFHRGSPCLVKALAGSGKTKVLTCRAAKLVSIDEVRMEHILMVTFTKKAAAEMRARLFHLLGIKEDKGQMAVGTFHHIASRILRENASEIGLDSNFTILDENEATYGAKGCFKAKDIKKKQFEKGHILEKPESFLEAHSKMINQNRDPLVELPNLWPENGDLIEQLVLDYRSWKRDHNLVDYDDLLELWRDLLENPRTSTELQGRWDHVMVDEYQDTNSLQETILQGLNTTELTVVGDAQQSIYGWRSAEPRNFTEFGQRYANAQIFPLEINYRSSPQVLTTANRILEAVNEPNRLKPTQPDGPEPEFLACNNEWDEARLIHEDIVKATKAGISPRQICVLTRAGRTSGPLEYVLNEAKVTFEKRGGIRITERKEIKHCTAIARVLLNPKDITAWLMALQLFPRIGQAKSQEIFDEWNLALEITPDPLDRHNSETVQEIIAKFDKDGTGVGQLINLATEAHTDPTGIVRYLDHIKALWTALAPNNYEAYNLAEREEVVQKQIEHWKTAKDLTELIETMSLSSAEEEERLAAELAAGKERIIISTIHSAKGLEWEKIYLIGAGGLQLPGRRAAEDPDQLAEEQRLAYVALTRARNHLTVTYPKAMTDAKGETIFQGESPLIHSTFIDVPKERLYPKTINVQHPDKQSQTLPNQQQKNT